MKYELGFIGCGNMGGALVTSATKTTDVKKIAVCDHNEAKVKKYENAYGVVGTTAEEVAKHARFVVLGVKPQMMEAALAPIAAILRERTDVVVITMAAGLSISAIRGYIQKELPIIRIMPNTPATLGAGMILYTANGVRAEEEQAFLRAFAKAGTFDALPEEKIDGGSALSGCGPAFVYAFVDALSKGGEECGLTKEQALLYATKTLLGAGEMLLEYKDPAALIKAVCSPNGTTLAGMRALEDADFTNIAKSAVLAAYKRTLELKK